MRRVLVLGAGIYQVPLIDRIRAAGDEALVASIPGDYPGIARASRFFPVNTVDCEAVVALARRETVDAVVTAGTDVALLSLASACEALGLPGPSVASARLATDKLLMKRAFVESGVRTAPFAGVHTEAEAQAAMEAIGVPLMLKCVDKSGSRGVVRVDDPDQVIRALRYALDASDRDYVVAERFVSGHEVGVDGYVDAEGRLAFYFPHDKVVWDNGKADVPVGHRVSGAFIRSCLEGTDLCEQAGLAARALGMRGCFFNMDVLLDGSRAWVIEAGVRTGATCIPELVAAYCGFDYYDVVLGAALGREPGFPTVPEEGAAEVRLLFSPVPARVVAEPPALGPNVEASLDVSLGAEVPAFVTGNNRCGQIVVSGPDAARVTARVEAAFEELSCTCLAPLDRREGK